MNQLHRTLPVHAEELDRLMYWMDVSQELAERQPVDSSASYRWWQVYQRYADEYDELLAQATRERDDFMAQADIDRTMSEFLYGGVG